MEFTTGPGEDRFGEVIRGSPNYASEIRQPYTFPEGVLANTFQK